MGSLEQVDALTETTSPCYPLARSKPIAQRYITDVLTIEVSIYLSIYLSPSVSIYLFINLLSEGLNILITLLLYLCLYTRDLKSLCECM